MLIEGLNAFLAVDSGVSTLLGIPRKDTTNGIFPVIAPNQTTMPYIVMTEAAGMPLQESFAGTGRLQSDRIRFSCYGTTYKSAKQLANAAALALFSCNGLLPGGSNAQVQGAWLRFRASTAEAMLHGTEFCSHFDFEFNWLDLA